MTVMFRNDQQIGRVCAALLAPLGLVERGFWGADGRPTDAAVALVEGRGGSGLSHGEAVLVQIAMDLWNGHGKATFDDLAHVLNADRTRAVVTLLLAANDSAEAVDQWLTENESRQGGLRPA